MSRVTLTPTDLDAEFPPLATFPPRSDGWPAPLPDAAYHGIVGEVVRLLEPHTEADPAAIAVQFLAAIGNAVGRGAGVRVEADRHCPNLFVLLVGDTSKGRKGTSRRQATKAVEITDPEWAKRITTGLVSGEGLIHEVRDPLTVHRKAKTESERQRADDDGYVDEEVDAGVADKRALIVESEFASTLRVMARDGNTLSAIIRQAWDGGDIRTMAKNCPTTATGAHVSIIGHITSDELRRELTASDAANGFANRFLFACVKRSKLLPLGGRAHEIDWTPVIQTLQGAIRYAGVAGDLTFDDDATVLWEVLYEQMANGHPGLLGSVTARAEAQTLRLATIYALLDTSPTIRVEHLRAAAAIWNYCESSAAHIFGDRLGDKTADRLLSELRDRPQGMTRSEMREMLGGRVPAERIDLALELLADAKLAYQTRQATGGRPSQRWFSVEQTEETEQSP